MRASVSFRAEIRSNGIVLPPEAKGSDAGAKAILLPLFLCKTLKVPAFIGSITSILDGKQLTKD